MNYIYIYIYIVCVCIYIYFVCMYKRPEWAHCGGCFFASAQLGAQNVDAQVMRQIVQLRPGISLEPKQWMDRFPELLWL